MRIALASVAVVVLLIVGCSKGGSDSASGSATPTPGSWKEFDPEQGKFTIKMPGDPKPLPGDGSAATIWGATAGAVTYSIGYAELSDPGSVQSQDQVEKSFDQLADTMAIRDGIAVEEPQRKQINFAGVSGREIDGTTVDKQSTRMRLCIVGDRRYRAAVTGSKAAVDSPETEVFFNSLKIAR